MPTPGMFLRSASNLHRPAVGTSQRALASLAPRRPALVSPRAADPAIDASSTPSLPALSLAEIVQMRKDLEQKMQLAVKGEDFRAAARAKSELEALNRADPVMAAKTALQAAIREERYEAAATIQSQIRQLEAELGPAALQAGLLSTSSTAVTGGIRVQVQSFFLPSKSSPSSGRYMFAYHVAIANTSTDTIVQLRNRHWAIMDGSGKMEEVRGPGVVGDQPIILPGKSYEYTSGCALATPQGSMEGEYGMVVLSPADGTWSDTLEVKIAKFLLDAKGPQAV